MMHAFDYNGEKYVFLDELVDRYNDGLAMLSKCPKQLRKSCTGKMAHCLGASIEKINLGNALRLVVSESAVTAYMNELNKQHGRTRNNAYYETRSALLARALSDLDPFAVIPFEAAPSSSSSRFSDTLSFSKPVVLDLQTKKKKKRSKRAAAPVMKKSPEEMVEYFRGRIQRRTELNRKDMKQLLAYKELVDKKIDTIGLAIEQMNEAVAA